MEIRMGVDNRQMLEENLLKCVQQPVGPERRPLAHRGQRGRLEVGATHGGMAGMGQGEVGQPVQANGQPELREMVTSPDLWIGGEGAVNLESKWSNAWRWTIRSALSWTKREVTPR
jgi:hypothetical protein